MNKNDVKTEFWSRSIVSRQDSQNVTGSTDFVIRR